MGFVEWIKEIFSKKQKQEVKLTLEEFNALQSQATLYKENEEAITKQKRQKLADEVGLDPSSRRDKTILDKFAELEAKLKEQKRLEKEGNEKQEKINKEQNSKLKEQDEKHKKLEEKHTQLEADVAEFRKQTTQAVQKFLTMSDVALKLQKTATYTKQGAIDEIDNAIAINNKSCRDTLSLNDTLIDSNNIIISKIEKEIANLKKKLSELQSESQKMFADKNHFFQQINIVNTDISKGEREIEKHNRIINKIISEKEEIINRTNKINNQLQKHKEEIEKIEVISEEEIKRIINDVIEFSKKNGIEISNNVNIANENSWLPGSQNNITLNS